MSGWESMGTLVVLIWWKGAVLLLLMSVLWVFIRTLSAGLQRIFLSGGVVALALLPAILSWSPRVYVGALEVFEREIPGVVEKLAAEGPPTGAVGPTHVDPELSGRETVESDPVTASSISWFSIFTFLWLTGGGLLALRFLVSGLTMQRHWRKSIPVSEAWRRSLGTQVVKLRLRENRVDLRESKDIPVPVVWGLFRPGILVPPSSGWDRERRDLVLLHELVHVARQDYLIGIFAKLALVVHWFNPLAWLLVKQLYLSREKACDDEVLLLQDGVTTDESYADLLLTLATGKSHREFPVAKGSLAVCTPGSSTLKHRINSILNMNTKRKHPRKLETTLICTLQFLLVAGIAIIAFGESAVAKDTAETEALKKRIAELESQIKELKEATEPVLKEARRKEVQKANSDKARVRMREDLEEYSREELGAIEELYQISNKNWRTPEAKEALEKLVKKYKKANRTGCAVLYLGQMSEGEEKETYLKQAVEDFSDCFYGNGCQVGGFGRYLLAAYYKDQGKEDKVETLLDELREDYATATGHNGYIIVEDFPLFTEEE